LDLDEEATKALDATEAWSQHYAEAERMGEDEDEISSPVEKARVTENKKQLLRTVEAFQGCDDAFFERLAERLIKKHFDKGVYVLAKGEEGGSIYFVHKGSVDVLPELDLPKIATLGVGSYFGEAASLTTNSVNAYIMAAEELQCYVLREHDVEEGVKQDAKVAKQLEIAIKKREVEREQHRSSVGSLLAASMLTGQENFEVKWRQGRPTRSTPRNVLLSVTGMGITIFDSPKTMRPLLTVIFEAVDSFSCSGPEGRARTFLIECRDGSSLSFATSDATRIETAAKERLAHIAEQKSMRQSTDDAGANQDAEAKDDEGDDADARRKAAFLADREAGAARRKAEQAAKPLSKKEQKQKQKEEEKRRKEEEKARKKAAKAAKKKKR
jgi:CRP-like cAMP-binding protein